MTLAILQAIEGRSDMTQRRLADRLGVALGLANSYLRRCVRKGLVKITQAPANRYLYYLTPKGFTEKTRLTTQYLVYSFDFYRRASASLSECLGLCREKDFTTIVFAGISELAEIGSVRAHDFEIEIAGSFEPQTSLTKFIGKPVWTSVEDIPAVDAAVFTALVSAPSMYKTLGASFDRDSIIVPDIVRPLLEINGKMLDGLSPRLSSAIEP